MADKKKKPNSFLKENKSLMATIPVFVILIAVVLWVYLGDGFKGSSKPSSSYNIEAASNNEVKNDPDKNSSFNLDAESEESVVILPELQRPEAESSEKTVIVKNPFATPYIVSGICISSRSENYCIIEVEGTSYVLRENESAGNMFKVKKIYDDRVVLSVDDKDIVIYKAEKE